MSREVACQFGMEIIEEIPPIDLPSSIFDRISYAFAKRNLVLPIGERGDHLLIALADPFNLDAVEEVRLILQRPVTALYCQAELLVVAIDATYRDIGNTASDLLATMGDREEAGEEEEIGVYDLLDDRDHAPIVKLLNRILSEAIQQGVSDIHFEPLENDLRVRYRIDGVLQTRHQPAREYQSQLLSRVKVISGLDIAEHRLPQDGRIRLRLGDREVDFRVSTIPVSNGERIVLRILDKGNLSLSLSRIGMEPSALNSFRNFISLTEGIVLVTGPTGSGKTTTLYSAITDLATDQVNIMTIEDPVEYKLQGIAQIGVRPKIGLTFAAGLRHILRQDPDIIMIGEIRDRETAEIAIQAALTGHLVLSTLHTNDAPSALTRLVDMGIEPYLLSSSVVGVLAQRLVRTLCPLCREAYQPDPTELKCLSLSGHTDPLYRVKGCAGCYGTGYRGRRGIYEVLPITHLIKQQITLSADALALRRLAIDQGMESLAQSGAKLVRDGATSIEEVLRVTRGIEEEAE